MGRVKEVRPPEIGFSGAAKGIAAPKQRSYIPKKLFGFFDSLIRFATTKYSGVAPDSVEADLRNAVKHNKEGGRKEEIIELLTHIESHPSDFKDTKTVISLIDHQDKDISQKAFDVLSKQIIGLDSNKEELVKSLIKHQSNKEADKTSSLVDLVKAAGTFNLDKIKEKLGDSDSAKALFKKAFPNEAEAQRELYDLRAKVYSDNTTAKVSQQDKISLQSINSNDAIADLKLDSPTVTLPKNLTQRAGAIDQHFEEIIATDEDVKNLGEQFKGFKFNFADLIKTFHNNGPAQAMEMIQKANLILEFRRADILAREPQFRDSKVLTKLDSQRSLMLEVVKDPSILDATGNLQRKLAQFAKSEQGKAQTQNFFTQLTENIKTF